MRGRCIRGRVCPCPEGGAVRRDGPWLDGMIRPAALTAASQRKGGNPKAPASPSKGPEEDLHKNPDQQSFTEPRSGLTDLYPHRHKDFSLSRCWGPPSM